MSKTGNQTWAIVDRWDVDDDGAEDMIVSDGVRSILLVKRHNLGAADPATWCMAYDLDGKTAEEVRRICAEGEHIIILAHSLDPLEWPTAVCNNIATAAR